MEVNTTNMNIISKDKSCSWKSFEIPELDQLIEEITEEYTTEGKKNAVTKEGRSNQTRPDQSWGGEEEGHGEAGGQVKKRLGGTGWMQQVQKKSELAFEGGKQSCRTAEKWG